ncbi:MBL fold metallo-hydrolase [Nonomuraea sp. NPDC050556]|uniref:MBL fold metallo-hydrolase n=1 Tax=Nonomuraea sp. NPDC050556 TaxID=3364369 RepID=UPI0037B1DA56
MNEQWQEVADRVFVRRHKSFDLNVGLVVGDGHCLVLDTRMSHAQGRDLIEAIRKITDAPWTVVNSHAHFDHFFGNAVFRPAEIWGLARTAELIVEHGAEQRERVIGWRPQDAEELAEVVIDPPDHTFVETSTLDIGGRAVHMRYFGRGHTDNDLVLHVEDAGVIFAGDLVEEGAPPAFNDGYPLDWPGTLDAMLAGFSGEVVVPGHGAVVDRAYVRGQREDLAVTAEVARRAHAEGRTDLLSEIPFPEGAAKDALERAFLQLSL